MARSLKLGRLLRRRGNLCHYCRRPTRKGRWYNNTATLDHVVPRSVGGSSDGSNLVLACWRCNQWRGSTPYQVFKAMVATMDPPDISPRPPHTRGRAKIAKKTFNDAPASVRRKMTKVARSGYLKEIGRYPVLAQALSDAGFMPVQEP